MKKALIFGASGFVGTYLLRDLLANPGYERVTAVVRKNPGITHPKLRVLTGDRESLPGLKDEIDADDVFIAVGTTKKKTPDPGEYYAIDHAYPVLAASIGREKGAAAVFFVSAVGANADSGIFYNRTKGEAERDIIALDFDHTHIFRPSIIMGKRPEKRPLEKFFSTACSFVNPFMKGRFRRYRGIAAEDIARAVNNAANRPAGKVTVYEWDAMRALL